MATGLMDFLGQFQNPEQADIRRIDNALEMPQVMPPQGSIGGAPWPVSSAADIAVPAQPAAPESFMDKVKGYFGDDEQMARLALGFNTMRMNPDQGLAVALNERIKNARENKTATQVADVLRKQGLGGEADLVAANPELGKVLLTAMVKQRMGGDITAEMQTFAAMTQDMSPEDQLKARRIRLGLDARAGLPIETYFSRGYATEAGSQAGKAEGAAASQAVSNELLRGQLNFGFDNLGTALGGTGQVGQIFGNLPAMTTSAQIADNAKAILLPIMKSVWRGAGEGVFTDKDQETLEAMFPTRAMTPEAAKQVLMTIRQLTELKLQNPKFDINSYGQAMRYRTGAAEQAPAAAPASPSVAPPVATQIPAVQPDDSKLLNQGKVMTIGNNRIVEIGK